MKGCGKMKRKVKKKARKRLKTSAKIVIAALLAVLIISCVLYWWIYIREVPVVQVGEIEETEEPVAGEIEEIDLDDLKEDPLTYIVFRQGNGSAILIDYDETEVLIDTGTEKNSIKLMKKLGSYIDGNLEYLVITSAVPGRTGGIENLYQNYTVETLITGTYGKGEEAVQRAAEKAGSSIEVNETENTSLTLGDQVMLTLLCPQNNSEDVRDHAVITYLTHGASRFLALSNMGKVEEDKLRAEIHEADLIVASGAADKDTNYIIESIAPRIVCISCSKKSAPDAGILDRFHGSTIFATYDAGDLVFKSNKKTVSVEPEDTKYLTEESFLEDVEEEKAADETKTEEADSKDEKQKAETKEEKQTEPASEDKKDGKEEPVKAEEQEEEKTEEPAKEEKQETEKKVDEKDKAEAESEEKASKEEEKTAENAG